MLPTIHDVMTVVFISLHFIMFYIQCLISAHTSLFFPSFFLIEIPWQYYLAHFSEPDDKTPECSTSEEKHFLLFTLFKGLVDCLVSFNRAQELLAIINVIVQPSLRNVKRKVPSNWITGNYFFCVGLVVDKRKYSQTFNKFVFQNNDLFHTLRNELTDNLVNNQRAKIGYCESFCLFRNLFCFGEILLVALTLIDL